VIKEKYPELGAKIGHDIDNISTSRKKFFPHLAWVSADCVNIEELYVIFLSTCFSHQNSKLKTQKNCLSKLI